MELSELLSDKPRLLHSSGLILSKPLRANGKPRRSWELTPPLASSPRQPLLIYLHRDMLSPWPSTLPAAHHLFAVPAWLRREPCSSRRVLSCPRTCANSRQRCPHMPTRSGNLSSARLHKDAPQFQSPSDSA